MKFRILVLILALPFSLCSQILTESNLPILVIDTDGEYIIDEPKITARLGIINNGEGQVNRPDDEFNDYDGFIGIELRGQTSQFFPKKPYGFETRNADGSNNNVSLLGMPAENDWVLHNPFSDKTLIRNALAYNLASRIMEYAPRTRMVEVILNEEYQGVYLLTEKIKRDAARVDIAKLLPTDTEGDELTGGYIFKIDKADEAEAAVISEYAPPGASGEQYIAFFFHYPKTEDLQPEQYEYLENFLHTAEAALHNDDFSDPAAGYRRYWDTDTFIDYFIINELTRNVDGYRISTYLHKDKDSNDPRIKIGPVWDYNLSLGNADYCNGGETEGWGYQFNEYCPGDFWLVPFWWERMLQDQTFKDDLRNRWTELRAGIFADERLQSLCDSLRNLTAEAADRNYQKYDYVLGNYVWPNNFIGNTWEQEIDYMCGWLGERAAWLDAGIDELTKIKYNPTDYFPTFVTPNLSDGDFRFNFYLNEGREVRTRIFDARGRLADSFNFFAPQNGENSVTFDGTRLPRGLYFYAVEYGGSEKVFSGRLVKM